MTEERRIHDGGTQQKQNTGDVYINLDGVYLNIDGVLVLLCGFANFPPGLRKLYTKHPVSKHCDGRQDYSNPDMTDCADNASHATLNKTEGFWQR